MADHSGIEAMRILTTAEELLTAASRLVVVDPEEARRKIDAGIATLRSARGFLL